MINNKHKLKQNTNANKMKINIQTKHIIIKRRTQTQTP